MRRSGGRTALAMPEQKTGRRSPGSPATTETRARCGPVRSRAAERQAAVASPGYFAGAGVAPAAGGVSGVGAGAASLPAAGGSAAGGCGFAGSAARRLLAGSGGLAAGRRRGRLRQRLRRIGVSR